MAFRMTVRPYQSTERATSLSVCTLLQALEENWGGGRAGGRAPESPALSCCRAAAAAPALLLASGAPQQRPSFHPLAHPLHARPLWLPCCEGGMHALRGARRRKDERAPPSLSRPPISLSRSVSLPTQAASLATGRGISSAATLRPAVATMVSRFFRERERGGEECRGAAEREREEKGSRGAGRQTPGPALSTLAPLSPLQPSISDPRHSTHSPSHRPPAPPPPCPWRPSRAAAS